VETTFKRVPISYATQPPSPDGYVGVGDSSEGSRMIGFARPAGWIRAGDGGLTPLYRIGIRGREMPGATT
jgi:hypothetical protein